MDEHYDLVVDGFVTETTYSDPDEILREVVLNGYDKGPIMASVVVWIHLPPNRVAVNLDFDQFKHCHREGRLPKAHQVTL